MAKRCQLMLKEIYDRAESEGDKALVVDLGGRRKTSRKDFVRLVNSGAYYLKKKGIAAGDIVALELGRSMEHIAMRLACHCIGAVYVSVNPDYPEDRKKGLYLSCNPVFILKEDMLSGIELGEYPCQIDEELNDNDPGVIVFTSGTTGVPKGILHDRSIYFAVGCMPGTYGFDEGEKEYAAVADMMFNVSTGDMFAIFHHWTMHIIDDETRKDPAKLRKYFIEHSIQVTIILPSLFRIIMPVESMKYVLLVGEPTTFDLSEYSTEAINFYGSSEAGAISYGFAKREKGIGRNYPHGRIYLIDEDGKEIEKGDMTRSGEVCFTGLSVMIGYLGKEALAEERIETEDGEEFIVRTFHTKDIGRYNDDGTITVFGRMDSTVKVRGNRVNTTEVEYAIINIPGIKEAAVKSFEKKGENYLCAYYTSLDGEELEAGMITDSLRKSIPEYMVPAFFIHKKEFEKNVHGKIDREKLEAPERRQKEYVKPQGEIEAEVAEVITSVTGISNVGAEDSLKYFGISSLSAIQLQMEIESRFSVDVPAEELIKLDTPRHIAEDIVRKKEQKKLLSEESAPSKKYSFPVKTEYPVIGSAAFILDRTNYMNSLGDDRLLSYNTPFLIDVTEIGEERAKNMIFSLINTHPGLKSRIGTENGKPVFIRRENWIPEFTEYNLSFSPDIEFFKGRIRKFDIMNEDLIRCEIYRYDKEVYLFIDIHHLLLDGYSIWLFYRDFREYLERNMMTAEKTGFYEILEENLSYRETEKCEENRKYYDGLLLQYPPAKYPESVCPDRDVPVYADLTHTVNTKGLHEKCVKENVNCSDVFLAAFSEALKKKIQSKDFSIFMFFNGREKKDTEHTSGCFYRHMPVTFSSDDESSGRLDYIRKLSSQIKESMKHIYHYDLHREYSDRHFIVYNYLADYERKMSSEKREDAVIIMPEYDFANIPLQLKVLSAGEESSVIAVSYNAGMYSEQDMKELLSEAAQAVEKYILH